MPSRYRELSEAFLGYRQTGVFLVAFNGKSLSAAGALDDLGSYCFIPWIAVLLRLPLNRTIDLFYFSILLFAVVFGAIGLFFSLTTRAASWLAVGWLAGLALFTFHAGDVYTVSAAVPLALFPWLMRASRGDPPGWLLFVFLFGEGLVAGVSQTVRSQSATALLIFTLCLLLFQLNASRANKIYLVTVLLAGVLVPQLCLQRLITKRDLFLASTCPNCPKFTNRHPFWHSVYIGFGFLTNEFVPGYDDTVAFDKVQVIAPGTVFGSPEYEHILRQEVLGLVRHHPVMVAATYAAKGGVILGIFLMVANFGLLAAARYPKPWPLELGFWLAIAFSSLPGLVATPLSSGYMLGFVTFAGLYAISSIDFALSNAPSPRLWQIMRGSNNRVVDATPLLAAQHSWEAGQVPKGRGPVRC